MTELITRTDLKRAIDAGTVTVVDALGGMYYEQQHLPGAVNLYVEDAAVRAAEVLPDRARRSSPTSPTSPARTAKASRAP